MEDDSDDDEAPDLVRVVEPPVDDELAFQTEPSTQPKSVNPTTPLVETELPPCPVTILSGFLGAGKTTLIRYILQSPDHGKKIAIIENEYGDALNIESLIAKDGLEFDNTTDGSNSLQEFIEVPNGCLCCTVKDSLVVTLENLIDKRPDLDCILIECSGLANPGPIANVFWLDDALQSRLYLESIVVVVDALHIANQLTNTLEASQQLGYADRVLINKSDLVQKSNDLSDVQRLVRTIQPTAPVWTTSFATVPDLDWILQTGCYTSEQVPTWNVPEDDTNEQHSHSHHDHGDESSCELCTGTHSHTQGISTLTLTTDDHLDLVKLNRFLADILWPNQDEPEALVRQLVETNTALDDVATTTHDVLSQKNDARTVSCQGNCIHF